MNQPALLRSLYWIGWLIWAVLIPWLLIQLPESLPFVTWTLREGVINVTWSYIVSGLVLFCCVPHDPGQGPSGQGGTGDSGGAADAVGWYAP